MMTPDEEREFIALWQQGLETAAIAQRLDIPQGTVSSYAACGVSAITSSMAGSSLVCLSEIWEGTQAFSSTRLSSWRNVSGFHRRYAWPMKVQSSNSALQRRAS